MRGRRMQQRGFLLPATPGYSIILSKKRKRIDSRTARRLSAGKEQNMPVVYGKDTPKLGFDLMRLPKKGLGIGAERQAGA